MNDIILQTVALTKKYKNTVALSDIDITIERGHIYGFIGENGTGKTTLLRIIPGLSFQTSGSLSIFSKISKKELENIRKWVGARRYGKI